MSDTPRTDAASFAFDTFNGVDPWEGERWIKVVPAKLAAQLERDLAAVTKERDKMKRMVSGKEKIMKNKDMIPKFPQPSNRDLDAGWHIDVVYLGKIRDMAGEIWPDSNLDLEEVEAVLLAYAKSANAQS